MVSEESKGAQDVHRMHILTSGAMPPRSKSWKRKAPFTWHSIQSISSCIIYQVPYPLPPGGLDEGDGWRSKRSGKNVIDHKDYQTVLRSVSRN